MKILVPLALIALIIVSSATVSAAFSPETTTLDAFQHQTSLGEQVNSTRIIDHLRFFSSLGSRVTGYPGCQASAEYIYQKFVEYGLEKVGYHFYLLPMPLGAEGSLEILETGESLPIYPVWPNLVCPSTLPPEGISGEVIYVGVGELIDFEGKRVQGSIVLMDYNSENNWMNAAALGAKAIIFLEPDFTLYTTGASKYSDQPFSFPRFYIKRGEAAKLLGLLQIARVTVHLEATTQWVKVQARNVVGFVKGSDPNYSNEIIILSGYYDSWSPVPLVAPGAEEAAGISVLLELASFFARNPPKYTIMFVAFSGHNQGLGGSRSFIDDFYFRNTTLIETVAKHVILQLNLGLSTGSRAVASTVPGEFYMISGTIIHKPFSDYIAQVARTVNEAAGNKYIFSGSLMTFDDFTRFQAMRTFTYDSEPLDSTLGPAWTLTTVSDARPFMSTPLDTYERLNVANLLNQAEFASNIIYVIANTPDLHGNYLRDFTYSSVLSGSTTYTRRWVIITGRTVEWNESKSWYDPLPETLIEFRFYGPNVGRPRGDRWFMISEENGSFRVAGVLGDNIAWHSYIVAYKVEPQTGNVLYAMDLGERQHFYGDFATKTSQDIGYITLFKAASVLMMSTTGSPVYRMINVEEDTIPTSRGYEGMVVFVPPEQPLAIIVTSPYSNIPVAVISGLRGGEKSGIYLRPGEQLIIYFPLLYYAESFFNINDERVRILVGSGVKAEIFDLHETVPSLLEDAAEALREFNYTSWTYLARRLSSIESSTYGTVRTTFMDITSTVPFFAFVCLPFVFLAERLFVGGKGMKRVASIVLLFLSMMVALYLVHPAFSLAVNASVGVVGVITLLLLIPILGLILDDVRSYLRLIRQKTLGLHFAEISEASAVMAAFLIGIENMRRRKLRTSLTFMAVLILMVSVIALTSVSAVRIERETVVNREPLYRGLMIRQMQWGSGYGIIEDFVVDALTARYGKDCITSSRAWMLSPPFRSAYGATFKVDYKGKTYDFVSILGLTPEEWQIFPNLGMSLIKGRWFLDSDLNAIILTKSQAAYLGVESVPEKVVFMNLNLTVVGIVDDAAFGAIKDLDEEEITPIDTRLAAGGSWNVHLRPVETLILPYNLARLVGAWRISVAATFKESVNVTEAALYMYDLFGQNMIFTGLKDRITLYQTQQRYITVGSELQLVPFILAVMVLMSTMLGAVYERQRDISTYSSIGMSPLAVGFMFLAEAMVYAVVGGLLGFILGMGISKTVNIFVAGMLPLNYSSTWVVRCVGIAMASVLLSSLYPMWQASKVVTPSLERLWKIPTKPSGDEWSIPLPFIFVSREAVDGVIAYLKEYLWTQRGEAAQFFEVQELSYKEEKIEEKDTRSIHTSMRLKPYELGILQTFDIMVVENSEVKKWSTEIRIKKISGPWDNWITLNRYVLDALRKQFLIWGSLKEEEKNRYAYGYKERVEHQKKS